MAAPKGNQFWKIRSKSGRKKLFASPDLLWDAACEYFEWCEKNPLIETKAFAGKFGVEQTELPKMRAMTLSQLCFYLNCSEGYFRKFKQEQKDSEDDETKDFLTVIHAIETIIYNQKFQGAAAGMLKDNIIAMELGLKHKTEVEVLNTDIEFKFGENNVDGE